MPLYLAPQSPSFVPLLEEGLPIRELSSLPQAHLKILILNLMPKKEETERHLFRMLAASPFAIQPLLLQTATHPSTHTPQQHLDRFYHTFSQIAHQYFDGFLLTGAPVEHLDFSEVDYWPELCKILEWSKTHALSTLHLCWGAQAALFYHYGIPKHPLPQKCFGVFPHRLLSQTSPLTRGFDDSYLMPHSRHTQVLESQLPPQVMALSRSSLAGLGLCASGDGRQVFCFGHPEYEAGTLSQEYFRDLGVKDDVPLPHRYFPQDDPTQPPVRSWRSHAHLLYTNWLNLCASLREDPFPLSPSHPSSSSVGCIGLPRGAVALCLHQKEWEILAQSTILTLKRILGSAASDIQHVGSTSIPSIQAKPIIDIAVAAPDLDQVLLRQHQLQAAGFYYRPNAQASRPNHLLFACGSYYDGSGDLQTHFIHVVPTDSQDWRNYLLFRDYLNATPSAASAYEALKLSLASQLPSGGQREAYLGGKHDFIVHTLQAARKQHCDSRAATL